MRQTTRLNTKPALQGEATLPIDSHLLRYQLMNTESFSEMATASSVVFIYMVACSCWASELFLLSTRRVLLQERPSSQQHTCHNESPSCGQFTQRVFWCQDSRDLGMTYWTWTHHRLTTIASAVNRTHHQVENCISIHYSLIQIFSLL